MNPLLLASAMQNRPLSSKGAIGLQTPVQVADRPITQQGLSGIRTGATGTRYEIAQFYAHFALILN